MTKLEKARKMMSRVEVKNNQPPFASKAWIKRKIERHIKEVKKHAMAV